MFRPSKIIVNYEFIIPKYLQQLTCLKITLPSLNSTLQRALSSRTPTTLKQVLSKLS